MVSLNQIDKVKALTAEGWVVVPPTKVPKPGGPVLMTKGGKYVLVYASSELVEPTADEIAEW